VTLSANPPIAPDKRRRVYQARPRFDAPSWPLTRGSQTGEFNPFLWGLGAFGQPGVDRVLEILQGELKLAMGNCGMRTVADITRAYVATKF
jgi:hypothetical protein